MKHSAPELPGVLADIARVAGVDAAMKISEAVGGIEIYLPPVPPNDHWLVQLVGLRAARAIADHLTCGVAGMRLELPVGPARGRQKLQAMADIMIAEGRSERDIALATGYSIRSVRRRRAKLGGFKDCRQGDLFGA